MICEEWREITDYPGYKVSNMGRVKGKYGKVLNGEISKWGYLSVVVYCQNKAKRVCVHRLVASAFIPQTDKSYEINHKDGDKLNNRLDNLEWCTKCDNILHSIYLCVDYEGLYVP